MSRSNLYFPEFASSTHDRRAFLAALTAGLTAGLVALPSPISAQEPGKAKRANVLQTPRGIEQLATRTRVVMQLSGTLKVADPDPSSKKPPREAEVKAESTVEFDERICMDKNNEVISAARQYSEAGVSSWIKGNASSHQLRAGAMEARLVRHEGSWQQYCPSGPMLPREIDMVRLPINSVVLDQLLPTAPVKAQDSWSPSERTIGEVFQLEAVHSSSIACRVVKVEEGVASIECNGDIEGTINSVPTRIKVNGNLQAAMASQCALVTWVGMSLTETREISQSEPGFTLTCRVKLIRKESPEACNDVAVDELRAIAKSNDDGRWLVRVASVPGRYQMLADRRWKTIVDTGEESILRLVEKNEVVAQCNITRLPKLTKGTQLTLEAMQDDIKRSLDKNLDQLLEASEKKNSGGMRVLRVVAVGKSSDVPVRWVYAHVSDDSGRRVSMVYTMSGEASEAFAMADEQMLSSLELLPESNSQSPTPAEAVESAAKPEKKVSR